MILHQAAASTVPTNTFPMISASGGNVVINGIYAIHTFSSSGDFEVLSGEGTVEYLVVGGGGGGGYSTNGGGGGGGGVIYGYGTVSSGSYGVVVGAGGAGGEAYGGNLGTGLAQNGGNSSFLNIVAHGGGAGATAADFESPCPTFGAAGSGASGGGGAESNCFQAGATSSYSGEGFKGGDGSDQGDDQPGSGGGAGGPGLDYDQAVDNWANGGPGVFYNITGTLQQYGAGGAARGTLSSRYTTGSANHNGFGGDNGARSTGSAPLAFYGWDGSDGVVVIRYVIA